MRCCSGTLWLFCLTLTYCAWVDMHRALFCFCLQPYNVKYSWNHIHCVILVKHDWYGKFVLLMISLNLFVSRVKGQHTSSITLKNKTWVHRFDFILISLIHKGSKLYIQAQICTHTSTNFCFSIPSQVAPRADTIGCRIWPFGQNW